MTKIAFFDVDGTLCTSSGEVLTSTVEAIRRFRKDGNLAYICTGRSKPEIIDSILEIGFDGIIGAGGGYVSINDEVVMHKTMPEEVVLDIIDFFEKNDIGYYLESNDGLFGSENCVRKIQEEIKKSTDQTGEDFESVNAKVNWFYDLIHKFDDIPINYGNVNKISFVNNTLSFSTIAERYEKEFYMYHSTVPLFGPESGEIAVKGGDKKKAVEFVLDFQNIKKSNAIAFGDGDNDLPMFEAVGYRVAMDNATDKLKIAADEVTADADNDGIAISLKKAAWKD